MASEAETLERWFATADANHDGRIDGGEAIGFFQLSGLPRETLKEIWGRTAGTQSFMTKQQFFGAIRLVSLAQMSGGSFSAAQAQQLLAGVSQPPPLPMMSGLTSSTWSPPAMSPSYQATGGATGFQPPSMQYTGGSLPAGPTVQVTGQVPFQHTGSRPEVSFPPLPAEEAMRYDQHFQSLDADRDGLLQGKECIEAFSSRGVARGVLKQIWQVVVGSAGQINKDQFIKCLYLIEISKQGIPVPVALPPGPFPPMASGQSVYAAPSSYGPGGLPNVPPRAVFQPQEAIAYPGWRGPAANEGLISTLDPTQRDRLLAEKAEAQKKDQQLYMMDQEAETARNKKEFYEKSLQELMLFKSRMDVASMEVQEKLKREQESALEAERRYDQVRSGAEEAAREAGVFAAALQEVQGRKAELESKLQEMQQSLLARERSQPEMIHQLEQQIQILQESVARVEQRRNTLTAEYESYKHQHDLLHRRQEDLQMACAAAEAEVRSASTDIEKIVSQVENAKDSKDVEQIQKLLREAARVFSNLHAHACKAGVEIPVEARLSLYGSDISWADDLIGAGMDVSGWQEDGFVLVDAFPDVQEDMDMEFEKAIQEAVQNIEMNKKDKVPVATENLSGDFGGDFFQSTPAAATTKPTDIFADAFQSTTTPPAPPSTQKAEFPSFDAFSQENKTSDFTSFDAFPVLSDQNPPAAPATATSMFAVSFDEAPAADAPAPTQQSKPVDFTAFDEAPAAAATQQQPSVSAEAFEADFSDLAHTFPSPQVTGSAKETTNKDDPFGDSAFN